jgi:hypothetical protein
LVWGLVTALVLMGAWPAGGSAQPGHRARDVHRGVRMNLTRSGGLSSEGGEVLHSTRTHVIFWAPSGSGLSFDPGYVPTVDRFMSNIAAASHSPDNVFGLMGQYYDLDGPAAYASYFAGGIIDTDPLPLDDHTCADPDPGWTVCLTDSQLQSEIEHVISARGLPRGPHDVYFLLTPNGFGSCMDTNPAHGCALGGPLSGYCGYHSNTPDNVLYAVIPYNAVSGHCQSSNPRPNGSTADPALSTISHELVETITDPFGNSWINSSGSEAGDLCLTNYGPVLGGSGQSAYDEVINGGHYYLQEEWSNAVGGCAARPKPNHVSFAVARRYSRKRLLLLRASARDPEARIVSYHWIFGDGQKASGRQVWHRFPRRKFFRVKLRVTDGWRNWTYFTKWVWG